MTKPVKERFHKLREYYVERFSTQSRLKLDLEEFQHWIYKDTVRWAKPLMSFEYPLNSLPGDKELLSDLEFLANVHNEAMAIS
jgi:hypothetical protein